MAINLVAIRTYMDYNKLFEKYSKGQASLTEQKIVDSYFDKLQNKNAFTLDDATNEIGAEIHRRIQHAVGRRRRKWYMAAAIITAVLTSTALLLNIGHQVNTQKSLSRATASGEHSRFILPDSSVVYLNAASSISYSDDFGTANRVLILKGEAYFEVRKNPRMPFIISSDNFRTEVLGTKFLIKNYRGSSPSVTVVTGKVKVTDRQSQHTEILIQNQRFVYDEITGKPKTLSVQDAINFTAWKDGNVYFHQAPWKEVFQTLERTYNVKFQYQSPVYACDSISGRFSGQNVEKVLQSLKFINGMDYHIADGRIINVSLKPCLNELPM